MTTYLQPHFATDRFYSVMASTSDSDSGNPGSTPGRTYSFWPLSSTTDKCRVAHSIKKIGFMYKLKTGVCACA